MINVLILVGAFIGDIILMSMFNVGFVQTSSTITPNLLFISLILTTYMQPKFKSYMIAIIVGLIMDSFNKEVLFLYTGIYLFTVFIVRAWAERINSTIVELFLLVLSAVFVKEVLIFFYYTLQMGTVISFNTFMLNHLASTMLFNLPIIVIGVFIKKTGMDREMYNQVINKRRASIRNEY